MYIQHMSFQFMRVTCILKAEPGKLDIKRLEPGILFISLPSRFTLQISDFDVFFFIFVLIQRH